MSSNKNSLLRVLHSPEWLRIVYPLGVVIVFSCIVLSAFFSYHFFLVMIARVTALQSLHAQQGVTFHLDEYRAIAPFFHLIPTAKKEILPVHHEKVVVVLKNAQLRNDRVILLQDILKNNGWVASMREDKGSGETVMTEPLTTIAAKETNANDAEAITALLTKNGFIVFRGKLLSKEEKADILITVGAY